MCVFLALHEAPWSGDGAGGGGASGGAQGSGAMCSEQMPSLLHSVLP